jgi:hypothetical protein
MIVEMQYSAHISLTVPCEDARNNEVLSYLADSVPRNYEQSTAKTMMIMRQCQRQARAEAETAAEGIV